MKPIYSLLVISLFVACQRFPTNPPKTPEATPSVFIDHLATAYVLTKPPTQGLVATKVNVLSFRIRVKNFSGRALEFYGRVVIEGPPECRDHAVQYRTDSVVLYPADTGYTFNTLENIEPETTYILVRPKYPTNEYSPFEDTQGMVTEVTITDAWAYDDHGKKIPLVLENVL